MRSDPSLSGTTIVAITGYGQLHDRARTAAVGFDHHLTKPVEFSALQDALSRTPLSERRRIAHRSTTPSASGRGAREGDAGMKRRPLRERRGGERKRGELLGEPQVRRVPNRAVRRAGSASAAAAPQPLSASAAANGNPRPAAKRVERLDAEKPRGVLEKRFDEDPVFE